MTTPPAAGDEPQTVFVASPIGTVGSDGYRRAKLALEYLVRKALTPPRWKVVRADEEIQSDSINQAVVRRLVESDLVVVDLTDHNPNVFYELAIAHCYRTKVVTIASKGTSIPFDIIDQRTIFYDLADPESLYEAQAKLATAATAAIESPDDLVTPVSAFERLERLADPSPGGDDRLVDVLDSISVRLGRLEHAASRTFLNEKVSDVASQYLAEVPVTAHTRSRLASAERHLARALAARDEAQRNDASTEELAQLDDEVQRAQSRLVVARGRAAAAVTGTDLRKTLFDRD